MTFAQRVLIALVFGYFIFTTLNNNLSKWIEIFTGNDPLGKPPELRE